MADGPEIEKLFREMRCLNAETNLKEICKYLRFSKNEDSYLGYLKHYLPMLPKENFDEFIDDVSVMVDGKEDKKATDVLVEELTAKQVEKYTPKSEEAPIPTMEDLQKILDQKGQNIAPVTEEAKKALKAAVKLAKAEAKAKEKADKKAAKDALKVK